MNEATPVTTCSHPELSLLHCCRTSLRLRIWRVPGNTGANGGMIIFTIIEVNIYTLFTPGLACVHAFRGSLPSLAALKNSINLGSSTGIGLG